MPAARTGLTAWKDTSVTWPGDQDLADVAVFAHTLKRLGRPRDRKHRIHDDAQCSVGEARESFVLEPAHNRGFLGAAPGPQRRSHDPCTLPHQQREVEACLGPRHGGEDHDPPPRLEDPQVAGKRDRKSTRLNSSHGYISYAVFCLKKKKS